MVIEEFVKREMLDQSEFYKELNNFVDENIDTIYHVIHSDEKKYSDRQAEKN